MDRYNYQPLDSAKGETRLFRLLPGSFLDDIEIDIFHVRSRFEEEEHKYKESKNRELRDTIINPHHGIPSYEALSYVWGSEAEPSFVAVRRSSKHSPARLSVTQNLADALRYLRKEDEARVLWVDAICINQQDLAEKGVLFRFTRQTLYWPNLPLRPPNLGQIFVRAPRLNSQPPDFLSPLTLLINKLIKNN